MDILLLGNVTRDIEGDDPDSEDFLLGGTVSYAALTCKRLQVRAELVTHAAADVDVSVLRQAARCTILHSASTTTFQNRYGPNGRLQYCYRPAPAIRADHLTPRMRQYRTVFLCPIMQDVAADVPGCFGPETFLAAGPQGWLRTVARDGRVHSGPWPDEEAFLSRLNVLILSREDIDHRLDLLYTWMRHVPLAILSNYRQGCDVFQRRGTEIVRQHVPPRPAREADPTGAGDIFGTAFLVRYRETGRVWESARFANVTASFGVEGAGTSAIPTRRQVLDYLYRYPVAEPGQ